MKIADWFQNSGDSIEDLVSLTNAPTLKLTHYQPNLKRIYLHVLSKNFFEKYESLSNNSFIFIICTTYGNSTII